MNEATLPLGVQVKTVGELTREIKGVLEEGFFNVWVSGQISNSAPRAGTESPPLSGARPSMRDSLLSAWNRVMAPVSAAPMPPEGSGGHGRRKKRR